MRTLIEINKNCIKYIPEKLKDDAYYINSLLSFNNDLFDLFDESIKNNIDLMSKLYDLNIRLRKKMHPEIIKKIIKLKENNNHEYDSADIIEYIKYQETYFKSSPYQFLNQIQDRKYNNDRQMTPKEDYEALCYDEELDKKSSYYDYLNEYYK